MSPRRRAGSAVRADEPEQRAERRRLADAVAAEQRGDPALRDVEGDALQDVRLPEVDVQVADGEERPRGEPSRSQLLPEVRLLHGLVRHDRGGRVAREQRPWCMTAIRWASPVTTSMWCSTISTVFRSSSWTERISSTSSGTFSTETPAIGSSSRSTGCRRRAASRARAGACRRATSEPGRASDSPRARRADRPRARSSAGLTLAGPPPEPQRPADRASAASRTFSRTVRSGKTFETWNVRPSPSRVRGEGRLAR